MMQRLRCWLSRRLGRCTEMCIYDCPLWMDYYARKRK